MSRIGRMPIEIPKGVKVEVTGGTFVAEGPKGRVSQELIPGYSPGMPRNVFRNRLNGPFLQLLCSEL